MTGLLEVARPKGAAWAGLGLGILLWTVHPASSGAAPLTDEECVRLLARDTSGGALVDAAARNLEAAALRRPAARDLRRASELVLDVSPPAAQGASGLCTAFVAELAPARVLLTGYYRPLVPARRAREGEFRHPLYGLPPPALRGGTRAEIDGGLLAGTTPVVAWLADPIEAFFIHIQGSALLDMPGGRVAVGYAGSNGRPYTAVGATLVRLGKMRQDEVSMETLKTYLRAHPSERDGILQTNERYIYFRTIDSRPIGSLGVPLTDGRSVAADPAAYPPGTLLFVGSVEAPRGVPPRLAFVQDSGSAITGPSRLDLFLGTGDDAGRAAGPLRQEIDVYILRPK